MLKKFSGNWQSVFTSVTLSTPQQLFSDIEETKILFHSLTDDQIHLYLQNCIFLDKAGSYAIQKSGSIAIARIEGSFDNVMGLPIHATKKLLSRVDIDLWKHLKSF
jgi:septum formation protein